MASVLTFNQVIDIFKDIAQRSFLINTFLLGKDWELENNQDITYPLLQVYPETARLPQVNGDYKTINISLVCKIIDLVQRAENNEKDVHSDCLQIAQDIINEINQHPYYQRSNASLVGDVDLTSLEEFEDDFTAGWQFTLNIQLINHNSYCGLPFEDIPGYSAIGPSFSGELYSVSYLTCETLDECSTFNNAIDNLQDQIDILSGNTDENYYTTGVTLSGNVVTFNRNDLLNAYSVDLSTLSPDLSGYLQLSGGTVTGNTIFSDRLQVGNVGNEEFEIRINNIDYNSTFKVSDIDGTNFAQNILHRHSTILEPLIVGARSNSDNNGHSAVTNSMNVFTIYGTGWNSNSYNINGQFSIATDDIGTLSSTSSPGKLIFSTTPNGSIWPEVAMQIHSDKSAVFESSISASSVSATTIFAKNQIWTVELIDAQNVDFYAPYSLIISSVSNVLNSPTITLKDDDVAYTTGNTIASGSKISVSASTASVVNLNILR